LWQKISKPRASLNNTLNEALRIHGGPAWQIFRVCISAEWSFLPRLFRVRASPDSVSLLPSPLVTGVGGSSSREVRLSRPIELRARLVPGLVRRP
jgi:hypothetical protein